MKFDFRFHICTFGRNFKDLELRIAIELEILVFSSKFPLSHGQQTADNGRTK